MQGRCGRQRTRAGSIFRLGGVDDLLYARLSFARLSRLLSPLTRPLTRCASVFVGALQRPEKGTVRLNQRTPTPIARRHLRRQNRASFHHDFIGIRRQHNYAHIYCIELIGAHVSIRRLNICAFKPPSHARG